MTLIMLMVLLIISIKLSLQEGELYGVIENVLILGIDFFALTKLFVVFYKNETNICEVIEKLEVHFPHSSVD